MMKIWYEIQKIVNRGRDKRGMELCLFAQSNSFVSDLLNCSQYVCHDICYVLSNAFNQENSISTPTLLPYHRGFLFCLILITAPRCELSSGAALHIFLPSGVLSLSLCVHLSHSISTLKYPTIIFYFRLYQ